MREDKQCGEMVADTSGRHFVGHGRVASEQFEAVFQGTEACLEGGREGGREGRMYVYVD